MGSPRQDGKDLAAVRDGQLAVVTCEACGCRLEAAREGDGPAWFHYGRMTGHDATGHRIPCVDAAHDVGGHASLAA